MPYMQPAVPLKFHVIMVYIYIYIHIIVNSAARVYGKYSTRGCFKRLIQNEAKPSAVFALRHLPSAVFFIHTSIGGALTVILYFLVVWLRAIFSSTQTAAIFSDQDISKCLTNLFLVVERTNRVWLVLAIYYVTDVINHVVLVESCLTSFVIRRSVSVYIQSIPSRRMNS